MKINEPKLLTLSFGGKFPFFSTLETFFFCLNPIKIPSFSITYIFSCHMVQHTHICKQKIIISQFSFSFLSQDHQPYRQMEQQFYRMERPSSSSHHYRAHQIALHRHQHQHQSHQRSQSFRQQHQCISRHFHSQHIQNFSINHHLCLTAHWEQPTKRFHHKPRQTAMLDYRQHLRETPHQVRQQTTKLTHR